MYEVLLKMHLNKANKLDEFFSLVFRSIKADDNKDRVVAFVRRLIQMACINEASFTAACLLIISELAKVKKELSDELYDGKSFAYDNDDDDEERFVDADKIMEQPIKPLEKVVKAV